MLLIYHSFMVIAYHLIWTAYGSWLPNDPRGSTSKRTCHSAIAALGQLHYGRRALQPAGWEIHNFYKKAPSVLKHALLTISPDEFEIIAANFAQTVEIRKYTCYACAIMPDHVHMLIRKHRDTAEQMIAHLQDNSRDALRCHGSKPPGHPVWGGPGWNVFQDNPDDIRRTIPYIEKNPSKMKMPPQHWPFVQPYNGWPLHKGHNPNSPYAKRQRGEPFKTN
jgi:REP element-mobilizing transposase RayT